MNTKKEFVIKSAVACLLIAITAALYIPHIIYFSQREYFTDYFINLITEPLFISLILVMVATLIFTVLPKKILVYLSSILLVFSLAIWIYADYFNVSYGALDGAVLDIGHYNSRGNWELLIFALLLVVASFFRKFINKQLPFVVGMVLIGQIALVAVNVIQEPADKQQPEATIDSEFFNYSSSKNIILIVLDTFGSQYFQKAIEADPSLIETYSGFVSYTDAISNYPATKGSVPSMLVGEMIPEDIIYSEFLNKKVPEKGLPQILHKQGYIVSVISAYTWFKNGFFPERYMSEPQLDPKVLSKFYSAQLLDYSLFRLIPHYLKYRVYNQGEWLFSREVADQAEVPNSFAEKGNFFLKQMTDNAIVSSETPRFKMIHVTTPHPKYVYNRDCSDIKESEKKKGPEAMLEQSMCALKVLNELLAKYKEMGIYDNSLIVVTSDHGSRVIADKTQTGFPSYFEMATSGILFMIKGIGQQSDFIQVDQPFSLVELKSAIMDEQLHTSNYDFLEDRERPFYAFRNQHGGQAGNIQDAPLFNVTENFDDPNSWQLDRFVVHGCESEGLPLKMTFSNTGREGYCSAYGFTRPHAEGKGTWTESEDVRVVLKIAKEQLDLNERRQIKLKLLPRIRGVQKKVDLVLQINGVEVGAASLEKKSTAELVFDFDGKLLESDELTVVRLLMPDVQSNKQMGINSDSRKLGVFLSEMQIN